MFEMFSLNKSANFAAFIWWLSGSSFANVCVKLGIVCSGVKIPDRSIKGKEIIRENNIAIPSLSEMSPIINPNKVFVIPTNRIKLMIPRIEMFSDAP